jgi:hypothetical protein
MFRTDELVELTLRVLYRCDTVAEQSPFDIATYSYVNPLLGGIFQAGGLGSLDGDTALEQLTLSLNIIRSHTGISQYSGQPRIAYY